jgi:multiple sugar transport system substrate-binding protein
MSGIRSAQGLTRRDALRKVGLGIGVLAALPLLQACGPGAPPPPTPLPKAASAPATVPAAAPTTAPAAPTTAPAAASTSVAAAKPAANATTVTFWYWTDNPNQAKDYLTILQNFSSQHPEISLKPDALPTVLETRQKVLTSFAAGAAPDTSQDGESWLQEFYSGKIIDPVEDRIKAWDKGADFYPNVLDMCRIIPKNPVLHVPNRILVDMMYYRKDLFDAAGLKPPDSYDDVLQAGLKLTKEGERWGYAMRGGDSNGTGQLDSLMLGDGVKIVDETGNVDHDSPQAIQSCDFWISMYTKQKICQPSAPADAYPQLFAAFQAGKIAMLHHGLHSWETQKSALGDKVASVMIPKGKAKRFNGASTTGTVLYSSSKNKDEAWKLVAYLGTAEASHFFIEWGAAPAIKSLAELPLFKLNDFYKVALASQPNWGALPQWHKFWPKYLDNWPPNIQRALKGETSPTQFAQAMAKILREG